MKKTQIPYLFVIAVIVSFSFAINHGLYYLSPLFLSLLIGMIAGNTFTFNSDFQGVLSITSKKAMRIGIALLGMQITFTTFADIGLKGFVAILMIVIVTFTLTRWSAHRLGFSPGLSLLMAGGFSICGASAIAAIGAARKSDKNEISYAVGLVTLLGTLSIFIIPPITRLLSLQSTTSGAWIGAAVHDVGQVIATASVVGGTTIKYAVITKLARVVLLAPLLLILSIQSREHLDRRTSLTARLTGFLPPFIASFLVLVVINNAVHFSPHVESVFSNISKFLLSMGLFSMAASVKIADLRKIGGRPLFFGITSWVLFGAFSLSVVRILGI